MTEVAMDDRQLNPLKTGVLFVAPGQIMDPGIMKLPHHPDHLSRLKADVGLDALEAELAPVARPSGSFHQLLDRIGSCWTGSVSSSTAEGLLRPEYSGRLYLR
jgi:hypothetical protein